MEKLFHQAQAMGDPVFYYTAVAAGLGTHAGLQFYEPSPMDTLAFFLISNIALFAGLEQVPKEQAVALLQLKLNLIYAATIFMSMSIYRVLFHRARKFPGPFWASVTKLWAFSVVLKGEYPRTLRKLHKKYGDVVRVGPREFDICNVHAINPIFGAATKCVKGPWYDGSTMGSPHRILQNEHAEAHQWKRRIWDAGFNSKSIRDYEPHVLAIVDDLINELKEHTGKSCDLGLYMSLFTFDIMGDLGFGKSFNMLRGGQNREYMQIVQGFANFNSLVCTIPWLGSAFAYAPTNEGFANLIKFAKERVAERLPLGRDPSDVFSHLLVEDRVSKKKYTKEELVLESFMLTIAGSDTTSSSLATIFYYLLANPDKFQKLKDEILPYRGPLDNQNLAKFPYLNGVVREALRMLPPIGSGMMHRETPAEGINFDGIHIPGNTTVGIGAYAIQRDPRYFGRPDEFIPERWMGEGPAPFDRNAFLVFSYGPYSCVGKHLAYVELQDVTASVVRAFDMEFAPGYDISSYETSIKDKVISTRAYLPVILKART